MKQHNKRFNNLSKLIFEMQNSQPTLTCKSFDDQYKRIQSFRNQYLNMIRIILKSQSVNKFPHLTMEDILTYNEIEDKITNINTDISKFIKNIKKKYNFVSQTKDTNPLFSSLINNASETQSNSSNITDDDIRMAQTFMAFLPFMICYYNNLNIHNIQSDQPHHVENFSIHIPLD